MTNQNSNKDKRDKEYDNNSYGMMVRILNHPINHDENTRMIKILALLVTIMMTEFNDKDNEPEKKFKIINNKHYYIKDDNN